LVTARDVGHAAIRIATGSSPALSGGNDAAADQADPRIARPRRLRCHGHPGSTYEKRTWRPGSSIRSSANTRAPGSAARNSMPNCSRTRPAHYGATGSLMPPAKRQLQIWRELLLQLIPQRPRVKRPRDRHRHRWEGFPRSRLCACRCMRKHQPVEWAKIAISGDAKPAVHCEPMHVSAGEFCARSSGGDIVRPAGVQNPLTTCL